MLLQVVLQVECQTWEVLDSQVAQVQVPAVPQPAESMTSIDKPNPNCYKQID
jgi:hypothetical protein